MFIGLDFFQEGEVYRKNVHHPDGYNRLEAYEMLVRQVYVDTQSRDINVTAKIDTWRYSTVLNAKFNGNMEAGSVEANNLLIESVKFQKRKMSELAWQDVSEKRYDREERMFYETMDFFISSGETYQYAIVPSTSTVDGVRVESEPVMAEFEGVFLTNKEDNFELLFNLDLSSITNNLANATFEPQNSKYPIVVSGETDYTSFDVSALFVSQNTVDNMHDIDVRMERANKDTILRFLKDGKPKVYRDGHGRLKLVMVVGNPTETPSNVRGGVSNISVSFVEIGEVNDQELKAVNLQETLRDVF